MSEKIGPGEIDRPAAADGAGDADVEDDVAGHNYEFMRLAAGERAREAEAWARKETVRREARGLRDRLKKKR